MKKKINFIINTLFYGIIGAAIIYVCKFVLPVLIPFIIAFLIAVVIQIPAKLLGKDSIGRRKAGAVFFCSAFYILFFLLVAILGVKLVQFAGNMIISAPAFYNDEIVPLLRDISSRSEEIVASFNIEAAKQVKNMYGEMSQSMGQYISDFSMNTVKWLSGGVAGIPGLIVKLVITIVATFFIAVDFPKIINFFKNRIPADKASSVNKGMDYVKNVVFIYIKSYSLLFSLTFAELSIGFLILRVPNAILLALLIAVFDIMPILGTGGILLPWALILFIMDNVPLAIGILALYIIITGIRNTLEPKIVGSQIGLHPVVTLIAMAIGLKLIGISGMIAFPVTLALIVNFEKNGVIHIFKNSGQESGN